VADFYIKYPNLKDDEVWKFDNKKILDKKLYQQALFETRKETYQAVEGLIHNLNQFGRHNSNVMNIVA
jgi:hypothetical protein